MLVLEKTPEGKVSTNPWFSDEDNSGRSAHQQNWSCLMTHHIYSRKETFVTGCVSTLEIAMVPYQVQIASCKKVYLAVLASTLEYTFL